ncbi:MAG: hypothetical protein HUJ25_03135 [Crocinitomicaceae bacterium]|nr:hypothetical protein [Crocinitomicaceae bacterium]
MKLFVLVFFTLITVSVWGQNMSQADADSIKLVQVDADIEAYRVKIEFVKSDPQEDSIATANGWYSEMNRKLDRLFDRKRQIIQSLYGKKWMSKEKFDTLLPEEKEFFMNNENYIIEQN